MTELDPITLEIIESALRGTRTEMDAVLYSTAMSPAIREQHDEFPLLTDPKGDMIVGQFGSYIGGFIAEYRGEILPGDIFFTNDPYSVEGAVSHLNDWMVLVPIFVDDRCVGWSSMIGHMVDVGGPVPGSLPVDSTSIFGEGTRIPPIKLYKQSKLDEELLSIMLANARLPEINRCDLFALIAAARAGERRVIDLCGRFGTNVYLAACEAMLKRTHDAMAVLIQAVFSEQPQSFEDWVDDDGVGNGPLRLRLSVWREGDKAVFDWTGTDSQSPGPINYLLNERLGKMFIGAMLIAAADPQIVFNDGYIDLLEVRIPARSLLSPEFPAPLCNRLPVLARYTDVVAAAIGQHSPQFLSASCFGSAPNMLYHGRDNDGNDLQLFEIGFGGIAGRPQGDGIDGHSVWPLFATVPAEWLESYFPIRIESYRSTPDSGGAGLHRGGNGTEKVYVFLNPGELTILDDRWLTRPWGVLGGEPGGRSSKLLIRADGERIPVPSKVNGLHVEPGDSLVFRVWGAGGRGDPLDRPVESIALDVCRGLVTAKAAHDSYGVVFAKDSASVDSEATARRRDGMRAVRGEISLFNFGPTLEEVIKMCKEETGLEPPRRLGSQGQPNGSSASGDSPASGDSVGSGDAMGLGDEWQQMEQLYAERGLGQRIGFGKVPALLVIDYMLAFTDPELPLGADLDEEVRQTRRLLDAARLLGLPIYYSVVYYDEAGQADSGIWGLKARPVVNLRAGTPDVELDKRLGYRDGEAIILKKYASAFFGTDLIGTDLISRLNARGVDTLIVTGEKSA